MPTLYLIRGVPGCGKSSLAYTMYNAGIVANVFEADQYFDNNGEYRFDLTRIALAHQDCQYKTRGALNCGFDVAVSNTSTTEREVETYARIAEECGAKFVSIIVENRHGGTNLHNVPEDKVQQMKLRFSVKL